jgi:hypothetical protein
MNRLLIVMAGLGPAIHVFPGVSKDVDGRPSQAMTIVLGAGITPAMATARRC